MAEDLDSSGHKSYLHHPNGGNMQSKILILCPVFGDKGGVAYYYSLVKKYFKSERVLINYYHVGKDYTKNQSRVAKTLYDFISLMKILPLYDLIILNPSLDPRSLIRDGVFHFFSKYIFHKRTLLFFHGWNHNTESIIDRKGKKIFYYFFNPDLLCVLSTQFKKKLITWGIAPEKIRLETTIFEKKKFEVHKDPLKVIFLSRFEEKKGCLEAIQTIEILIKEFPEIKLFMAGDGEMTSTLKDYVISRNLNKNVEFTGYLSGDEKYSLLSQCGIMLYPTNYGEGMPISLLEGMGMGCVVITRPIAGIKDIISEGENGFLIESLDADDFAMKIKYLLKNFDIWQAISSNSSQEAYEKFEIRNVVKRLENIYSEAVV